MLKNTWEYTDGKDYYGTWFFFIPEKPMAILMPILYMETEPGKQLGCIFYLKDKENNSALPLQPMLNGENTKKLIEKMQSRNQSWIQKTNRTIRVMYRGKEIIPYSSFITPYKLVYNENNTLQKITMTKKVYDYPVKLLKNIYAYQQDDSILVPPPIIREVGKTVLIVPYNNCDSILELISKG